MLPRASLARARRGGGGLVRVEAGSVVAPSGEPAGEEGRLPAPRQGVTVPSDLR